MSLPQQFSLYMGEFSQIEIIFDVSSSQVQSAYEGIKLDSVAELLLKSSTKMHL